MHAPFRPQQGNMITSGKIIEYLDNGKFICALITDNQTKRVRLINQNGREVNLPVSRIIHCTKASFQHLTGREELLSALKDTAAKRETLMEDVNLEEIWELINEENTTVFDPTFLAELSFGHDADDDTVAAFLRTTFSDRLFFKFKEGKIKAHTSEQVEQLRIQQEKQKQKQVFVDSSVLAIQAIMEGKQPFDQDNPDLVKCMRLLRDYYLFANDAKDADLARTILKTAGLNQPHAPFHILVTAGIWDKNENIPILRHELPIGFSLAALQQAEAILQRGHQELFDDPHRKDFTHLSPITIDGATTLDYDDALTIAEEDGNYLVGVHISDVAHYVRPGDALFQEAMQRGTSLYFPERQVPMLPRHLSQGICSLIQGEIRAAFSFMILLSPEAEVLRVRINPSIIKIGRRMTYEEVDKKIATDPELKLLDMLRKKLRTRRLEAGALLLPFPDVNIFIDPTGKVHVNLGATDTPSRILVSEMMILANTEAARYVADRMVPGLYRSQGPPKQRIVHGEDTSLFQNSRQRKQLSRGELLVTPKEHCGLGVPQYSTVTSPIRRLLDLVMQHQLHSIVRRKEPTFTQEMCQDFSSVITRTISLANNVKNQRHRYWLLKYLEKRQGSYLDALVIDCGPKRVNLLLTDIMMDIDMPATAGAKLTPDTIVQVKVTRVDALDNYIRFEW